MAKNRNSRRRLQHQQLQKKPKICVCVPVYYTIPAHFFINFIDLLCKNMSRYVLECIIQQDIPVDKARNEMIKLALQKNADYILMLDNDNLLPKNGLDRLVEVMEQEKADFVTGIYFEKKKPYYPVLREYHDGGFWKIENPPLGKVIKIDGCGLGCCLVKPEVFRKTKYPWFKFNHERWGYKDIQLSEDLYFCRQLREKGFKMVCDTGLISSHIGGMIDAFEYMSMKPIRQAALIGREEAINDISEFTKLSNYETNMRIMVGSTLMANEWKEKNPKTTEEIKKFYKETKNYIYDLFYWHFTTRRQFDIELITGLQKIAQKNKTNPKDIRILDFACGIGQNAYMLAQKGFNVTIADLDGYTLDFAKFRFDKHKLPYKLWKIDVDKKPPEEKYDVICCFDVFEHLPKSEFRKTIKKLMKLKHEKTKVLITVNFGKTDTYLMHFESDEETIRLINELAGKRII